MNNRKLKYTSLSVRVWVPWLEIVKTAADKQNVTVPEYVRERLGPVAAKDAGIPFPGFPQFGPRGRPSKKNAIEAAAAKLHMTVREFRNRAIEVVAAQAMRSDVSALERTLANSLDLASAHELEDTHPTERRESETVKRAARG